MRLRRWRQTRLGLLFISPWVIGFAVFYLYPFFATLYYSFTSFTGVGNPVPVGLANYSGLIHDGTFRTALFNTFYYTIIEVPLSTAAALGLAILLNMKVRGQAIYRTLFYMPSIVPVVASSLIFVWIFQPSFGVVNSLLTDIHVQGPTWFFSITWSKPTFILLGLWGLGQPMVIYLAALQGVPKEMYEVAALEGAGPLQRLRNVTLPMISPIILFNVILSLVLSIQYFTQAARRCSTSPITISRPLPTCISDMPQQWHSCFSSWSSSLLSCCLKPHRDGCTTRMTNDRAR